MSQIKREKSAVIPFNLSFYPLSVMTLLFGKEPLSDENSSFIFDKVQTCVDLKGNSY
jgi:hypothetical protein